MSVRRVNLRWHGERFVGSTQTIVHSPLWRLFQLAKCSLVGAFKFKKKIVDTHNYGTCVRSLLWICCTQFDSMAFFACYCVFGAKYMVQWLLISFTTTPAAVAATAYYDSFSHSFICEIEWLLTSIHFY